MKNQVFDHGPTVSLKFLILFLFASGLFGCARPKETLSTLTPPPPVAPSSESYSAYIKSDRPPHTTTTSRLSRFFLVEQSSAGFSTSLGEAFRRDPPGGIVFWNSSRVGWRELAATTSRYSRLLKENGHLPAFFSVDNEGGGLTLAPSGRRIPGIQRFRDGFTDLVHGNWLGRSLSKYGTELCSLHGRIMSRELAAVGVNFPLTLVSDLAQRLFLVRGVSSNPQDVAICLSTFTKAVADAAPVVTVTKHYPGLGQNSGDTHDVESVSTAKIMDEALRHLNPFRDLISYANQNGYENRLSVMSSHGKFPLLDERNLTTESAALLTDLLRDRFQFKGVRVSDAMWMGGYGSLQGDALYAVYLNAFVSGLDLLMIPGGRYGGALRAFTQIYEGTAGPGLKNAVEVRSGLSFDDFRAKFLTRTTESLSRLDMTLKSLPYAHETVVAEAPRNLTTRERNRYYDILRGLDQRWISELGPPLR